MTLMSLLLSLLFVAMSKCQPISYVYDERELSRDNHPLLLLVDHRIPDLENEMFDSGNDPESTVVRTKRLESKRIGSLSIVNSLDVLRQRVLLELARRKALQDQQQIDANRRILKTIGKRSLPLYNKDVPKAIDSRIRNGIDYVIEQEEKSHDRDVVPERIRDRMQNWLRNDDSAFRERQDDQMRRIEANELRLL